MEHVHILNISSEDRLTSATEKAIQKKPHPLAPFLDQGTKTNNVTRKLQEIFTPRQQNEVSTCVTRRVVTRIMNCAATRVILPIIDDDEIGTIIMKRCNNTVQGGEVTHYFDNEKLYLIVYDNEENEKISFRQPY